jgi:hypothetical protein
VYLLLYVDDFIIAGNNLQVMQSVKAELMKEFKMKDLGDLNYFLGIRIDRTKNDMILSQSVYLKKLLARFQMESCKPVKPPLEVKPCREVENGQDCIVESKPYRELIECLMYVMLTTRPDLSAAVNFFSRFQTNATDAQWFGIKCVLRYVQGTIDLGLFYKKGYDVALTGYADSDWAGDTDRRSTTGYLFEVYGAAVNSHSVTYRGRICGPC